MKLACRNNLKERALLSLGMRYDKMLMDKIVDNEIDNYGVNINVIISYLCEFLHIGRFDIHNIERLVGDLHMP